MILLSFGTLEAALRKIDAELHVSSTKGTWRADLKPRGGTVVVGRGSSAVAAIEDAFREVKEGAGRPPKRLGSGKGRFEP
jgi:hypothetical protein